MSNQLIIRGSIFEINDDLTVNYQVNDIAELTDRQATYTNSFDILRTPEATRLFDQLGMPGDTSSVDCQYIRASLLQQHIPLVRTGRMEVTKTTDCEYSVALYEGIIDFFATIGDAEFGSLSMPEIEHVKDPNTIEDTWNNDLPFRYLIADYGGMNNHFNPSQQQVITADYQIPAVKVSYLWDKIFDSYGWSYTGSVFSTPDFQDLKITIPKAFEPDITAIDLAIETEKDPETWFTSPGQPITGGMSWDTVTPGTGDVTTLPQDDWDFQVQTDGLYRISVLLDGQAVYGVDPIGNTFDDIAPFILQLGGSSGINKQVESEEFMSAPIVVSTDSLATGDIITFRYLRNPGYSSDNVQINLNSLIVTVEKLTTDDQLTDDFLQLKVKDFFKEIVWRFGLTPFTDPINRNVEFLTLAERLDPENIIDWTEKIQSRDEQTYSFGTYGKDSWLRYKYDIEGDDYNDGRMILDNDKLPAERTMLESKTYSPTKIQTPTFGQLGWPTWDGERDEDGEPDFKLLTNRFFFQKEVLVNNNITVGSYHNPAASEANNNFYYRPTFQGLDYQSVLDTWYVGLKDMVECPRIEKVTLCLSPVDAHTLDLRKLYSFAQLGGIYIINKLTYKSDGFSEAELVKVKPIDVFIPA